MGQHNDLQPHALTHLKTIVALAKDEPVDLETIGWADLKKTSCPDCHAFPVYWVVHAPNVRFQFGMEYAVPHKCGRTPAEVEQTLPQRLERLANAQAASDELRGANWTGEYIPAVRKGQP